MLISFSGPSSAGKSTLLEQCKQHYKDRFTYVEEITRKIQKRGLPINEQGNDITQLLILNSHIENSLLSNAILDRCILDGVVYTEYLNKVTNTVSYDVLQYSHFVYSLLIDKYDVIFYTEPVTLVDDGVRSINQSFRDFTIKSFDSWIENEPRVKSKTVKLSGSVEERMKIIQSVLK